MKIAYISDIHIEFLKRNLNLDSIKKIANLFIEKLNEIDCDFAIIAGDISHCIHDTLLFLDIINKNITKNIYVCLGNHDYWNWQSDFKYKSLKSLSVIDIENLFLEKFKNTFIKPLISGVVYNFDSLVIIGDCGFAGYNMQFNALNGIYRGTIKSLEEERKYTDRWLNWYNENCKSDTLKILIITHMPYHDWGGKLYLENKYYICGHIHDCYNNEAIFLLTDFHKGDAANGYLSEDINFKEIII